MMIPKTARTQRDIILEILEGALNTDTWLTLKELHELTRYPEASISAQIRHLRKSQFGGHRIAKRWIGGERGYEYQLQLVNISTTSKSLDATA